VSEELEYRKKLAELKELEEALEIQQGLPHLYGFPWYTWAKDFFDSTNKENFLVAANQLSKSATQWRKCIDWATDTTKWQKLWPGLMPGQKPNNFWYFYPTADVFQAEWETKIEPDYMPRGKFKSHPIYGWEAYFEKGKIKKIEFNSGVTVYCKTYGQKAKDLQTGSVYALWLDEELGVEFLPELQARLNATDGYFHMVFTATLGQEHWRKCMEPTSKAEETHPNAFKRQVSLYDCLKYADGSRTPWTVAKIKRAEAKCPTENEKLRRIYGRFIKAQGLKYESFSVDRNLSDPHPLPKSWLIYAGIDPGSGGLSGHPAAIVFIAVRPDFREGRVFRAWRGDGIATDNSDILNKYRELRGSLVVQSVCYDYKDKDFFLVASKQGEPMVKAEKTRNSGEGLLNTLFKNSMLKLQRNDAEIDKLVNELCSLSNTEDKRKAHDDLCFAGKTKIFTNTGDKNIEDVCLGDMVLTRKGFRPVIAKTISMGYVVKITHNQGETWATKTHNYITTQGPKPVKNLLESDICYCLLESEKQRLLSLVGLGLEDTQKQNEDTYEVTMCALGTIERRAFLFYTEKFGSFIMGKSRRALLFIILMGILLIIQLRIYLVCLRQYICQNILPHRKEKNGLGRTCLNTQFLLQPLGIKVSQLKVFIEKMGTSLGSVRLLLEKFVRFVVRNFLLKLFIQNKGNFAPIIVNQKIEECQVSIISNKIVWSAGKNLSKINIKKLEPALCNVRIRVEAYQKPRLVYNITVVDEHEYFADGILVANCDATRYTVMSIPWDFSGIQLDPSLDADKFNDSKKIELSEREQHLKERRDFFFSTGDEGQDTIDSELDFWNDLSGA
jgi:hypothetical protein